MPHQQRQSVLIIDDTLANIEILDDILSDMCDLLFATSGPQGIELAVTQKPDLILLDIMMPDMDGYQVCQALKAEPCTAHIPVVFASALGNEADEAKGLEIGAIDYVTKPISAPIVRARVRNHLELKRQRDLLARLGSIDGLTGIANRRAFDQALGQEWRRAQHSRHPVAVLMIDVDYFKLFNDTNGHGAGDDCLKLVADALASAVTEDGALVARYGGEEFVCLLPGLCLQDALIAADKLHQAVRRLGLPHPAPQSGGRISVSIGAASLVPEPDQPFSDLMQKADVQLYAAKRQGRNRVVG